MYTLQIQTPITVTMTTANIQDVRDLVTYAEEVALKKSSPVVTWICKDGAGNHVDVWNEPTFRVAKEDERDFVENYWRDFHGNS